MKTPNVHGDVPARWQGPARTLLLLVGVCVVLAAGLTAAFVSGASARTNRVTGVAGSATLTDPAGDSHGAPDITTVAINGDPATGIMTVTVTATGIFSSQDGLGRDVYVWLDTDKNASTGSLSGCEYALMAWSDSEGRHWNLSRWNGNEWVFVPSSTSATQGFTRSGDVLTWTLGTADLGGATGFALYASTVIYDASDNATGRDFAPDIGRWTYDISATTTTPTPTTTTTTPPTPPTKVKLLIDAPKTSPARAVAGKPFTVTFDTSFQKEEQATSFDVSTGQTKDVTMISWSPVPSGKMVCDPSVAGKVIAHRESFKNSQARLSFVIPKTAKGKPLRVAVKITATEKKTGKTVSANKIAMFHVR